MRSSMMLLVPLFVAACGASDSMPSSDLGDSSLDAASPSDASGDAATDAGSLDGAVGDGGALGYCQSPAAVGAAFCADFEQAMDVGAGWDDVTMTGSGSLALDPLALASTQCARARVDGTTAGQAMLSQTVVASGGKSRVVVEFDGYWSTTGWTGSDTFVALVLKNGSSSSYYIEIERNTDWVILLTGDSEQMFPSISEMAWHHVRISYDGSGATGDILLTIDGVNVKSLMQPKGNGPSGAPATFDSILLELGVTKGAGSLVSSFYFDNVIVRYP